MTGGDDKGTNEATTAMKNNLRYKYLLWRNAWPGSYNWCTKFYPVRDYGPHYVHLLVGLGFGALTHWVYRFHPSRFLRGTMTVLTGTTAGLVTYDYLKMVRY